MRLMFVYWRIGNAGSAQPQAHDLLMEARAIFTGLRARSLIAETDGWLRQNKAQGL